MISKKTGYKKSILGDIPDNWQVKSLGEIFEFKNGLNKEKKYFGRGTPIVNYVDVYNNRQVNGDELQGTVQVTDSEKERFNVQNGDVFFTRTSETIDEIGYSSVAMNVDPGTVFSGFVLRAREKQTTLDNLYKKYCFSTYLARKEIITKSSMTTRALTSGTLLSGVNVIIPPLEEQKKIANILSTWDRAVEIKSNLISAKEKYMLSLVYQVFQEHSSETTYKIDSLIDEEMKTSRKSSEGNEKGQYPFFTNSTDDFHKYLDDYDFDGEFIVANTGGKAYFDYYNGKFSAMSDCYVFSVSKTVNPRFLYYKLKVIEKYIDYVGFTGSGLKHLDKSWFKRLEVKLPSVEMQLKIIRLLDSHQKEIALLKNEVNLIKYQKQGLMQQLLTGKIRVQP